jgi:hypothetical protein
MHKNESKDEHFWCLEDQPGGSVIISSFRDGNLVLDVSNANTKNGTLIKVHERNGNNAQLFDVYTISGGVDDTAN